MNKKRYLLLILVILALMLASCERLGPGAVESEPGGSGQETAAEATEAPATETEEEQEAEAEEAEAEETEEEEAEAEEAEEAQPTATPDQEEDETEIPENIGDVMQLDSYKQTIIIRIAEEDEAPEEVTMIMEVVREPPARHMVMTSETEGEETFMEWIQIGDTQYMHVGGEGEGEDEWFVTKTSEDLASEEIMGDLELLQAEEILNDRACNTVGREKVNGLQTQHYKCDMTVMEQEALGLVEGESDIWVSTKYNLPIKVIAKYISETEEGEKGTFETEQLIENINEPIDIKAPEGVEMPGLPDDIPLMDDATDFTAMGNIVSFVSPSSVEEVQAFYEEEMPKEGWTREEDQMAIPGMFSFTKDDRTASFIVGSEDEGSSVTIMIE